MTYVYLCQKCGLEFEAEQRITDAPLEACQDENCDGHPQRQISSGAFVLLGSGWYRDGY
jgi:putative FmdB family regulatory protein